MTAHRLAIIPARGGSKRLPGKNIYPFFGHPLLAYSVAAAVNSGLFERVIVSTDDSHIGEIGAHYGGEFLPRPGEFANDVAPTAAVVLNVLETLGRTSDSVCVLMPIAPLRTSQDVLEQYELFEREQRLFQISVVRYRCVHPHWALQMDEQGRGNWVFGDYLVPSQTLGIPYCPSGAVWWARVPDLIEQRNFYGNPYHLAVIDGNRGIDIDDKEDMELAELIVRGLHEKHGTSPLESISQVPYMENPADE